MGTTYPFIAWASVQLHRLTRKYILNLDFFFFLWYASPLTYNLQCAGSHQKNDPPHRADTMSFTNAPVTRSLVYGLIGVSIAVSLLDIKHYFYILVDLHLWQFHQTWRALIYQLCYTNSSEVLFAAMTIYNMRSVERMWGSRKFAVSASSPTKLLLFYI